MSTRKSVDEAFFEFHCIKTLYIETFYFKTFLENYFLTNQVQIRDLLDKKKNCTI